MKKDFKALQNPQVAGIFNAYPEKMRENLMLMRLLIFDTASETEDVGKLEETLKWGQPYYLTEMSPQTGQLHKCIFCKIYLKKRGTENAKKETESLSGFQGQSDLNCVERRQDPDSSVVGLMYMSTRSSRGANSSKRTWSACLKAVLRNARSQKPRSRRSKPRSAS